MHVLDTGPGAGTQLIATVSIVADGGKAGETSPHMNHKSKRVTLGK